MLSTRTRNISHCVGWGHSSYRHAFEFAARVGAKKFVPFHHDPSHDDETLDRLLEDGKRQFAPAYAVSAGLEGAVFELPAKPRAGQEMA